MTARPLAGGDVHRDFEAEAEVTSGRGFPFHFDSLRYGFERPATLAAGCPPFSAMRRTGLNYRKGGDLAPRGNHELAVMIFMRFGWRRLAGVGGG